MEKFSKISIDFTVALVADDSISFDYTVNNTVKMTWKDSRQAFGQVEVAATAAATAANFTSAFNADYNSNALFIVEQNGSVVDIYCTVAGIDFSNEIAPSGVNITIDNSTQQPFEITDISFLAGDNCDEVKVSVTTNVQADEILSPFNQQINSNPFIFDYDRFLSFELVVKKNLDISTEIVATPARIFPSGITVDVNSTPAGASATINAGGNLLNLTYSLDGSNFTTNNTFTNLIGGDYTAYVKDQFNCVTEKDFRIDSFGINAPYFYLPTANSIRYALRVNWGDCANYKNDDNTLSCEVDTPVKYQEIQLFQSCDKIITQFKSNYQYNKAYVLDGSQIPIPVVKKTNNMRLTDRRDATMLS